MNTDINYRKIWDLYTQSWRGNKLSERLELFKKALDPECCYIDPLTSITGWDSLGTYMEEFHKQVPGGYFETIDFLSHHNFSVARWNMKSLDDAKIGEGYSVGEYNNAGKLTKMTGFYKLPK